MIYDIELKKQRLVISDDELIKLIEQRFKYFTDRFRLKCGVVQEYKRARGDIMFDWHTANDQSEYNYQRVKSVYDLIESFKQKLKSDEL